MGRPAALAAYGEWSSVRIVIQKFGGTSVATPEAREALVLRVKEAVESGRCPVVVVSAMGRVGDPYATDTLIQLARSVYPDTAPRELDLLISCGEIISAVVVANTLKRAGMKNTIAFTGGQAGIITDRHFGDARILRVEPDHLHRHLERGDLVVVAGFQGVSETGEITTLGRGGSDTTAAALGIALRAEVVEIFTDVDGVKTADPRIVPEARTLQVVSYEEVLNMANEGARVVHPRAVELAMRANVPLRVRHTMSDAPGTLITHALEAADSRPVFRNGHTVTAVAQRPGVAQVAVLAPAVDADADLRVFRPLADAGISVDLINVFPDRKCFIVAEEEGNRAKNLLEQQGFQVLLRPGCAKVSVVGTGMRGVPGVMANVVEALHQAGVEILQTADSHMTISCLVKEGDMHRAVRALHARFGLGN